MARRSKMRRVVKWSGTAAFLLLLGAWLVSGTLVIKLESSTGNGVCFVSGWCCLRWGVTPDIAEATKKTLGVDQIGGFEVYERSFAQFDWDWHPILASRIGVVIPGWYPVGVAGALMAVLWWLDRRRIPPGHCRKCGYDLTGNVSGVCSECGASHDGNDANDAISHPSLLFKSKK